MWGGDYLPEYIGGYICGSIRAGKPCSYKQLGEMRTFRFIVNQKWIAKNGMERRDAEAQSLFFLREQSAQRVAFSSVSFAFSLNYSSASLSLCVRFFANQFCFTIIVNSANIYLLKMNIYCMGG